MPSHGRSDNRTPATYRTTRPSTYRTGNPAVAAASPSMHSTAGRYAALPHIVAPVPAAPGQTPQATAAPHDTDDRAAVPTVPTKPTVPTVPASAGTRRTVRVHPVDSDCLIGVRDPHRPGLLRARSVDAGGHPQVMLPVLRRLWNAAGHDSIRLAARLLACDWRYLDPDITTTAPRLPTAADTALSVGGDHAEDRRLPGITGRPVITGVGTTHTATGPDTDTVAIAIADSEPATVVPLAHLGLLDAAWLYLFEPADDAVAVYTGDGVLISRHLLAA